jgi:phosphoenolpyruvate---glycerone phosphotransferase subunit DhaM
VVNLVLVSHSRKLAEGLRTMAAQMAGDEVRIEVAAGTPDGRLGTSAPMIVDAIRRAAGDAGALVLLDLGSAALSIELALEDLEPEIRERVAVSDAPLVEGTIAAAVQASLGATLAEVSAAAREATSMPKLPGAPS